MYSDNKKLEKVNLPMKQNYRHFYFVIINIIMRRNLDLLALNQTIILQNNSSSFFVYPVRELQKVVY